MCHGGAQKVAHQLMAMREGAPWCRHGAVEVVRALREGRVTSLELIREAKRRIEAVDGLVNAIPTTCFARAEERARRLRHPTNPPRGYLWGLPVVIKDTLAVEGVRFTLGSLLHEHDVAERDDPVVQVLEEKGAIVIGKTNTPEFGLGSNTYNKVFGETVNPFDTSLTAGGSSGGAAAALASGAAWLAIRTDLGGSLRIPAAFCSVVGMRPTPGLVPNAGSRSAERDNLHSIVGPMARSVGDLALLLDAIAEPHEEDANCRGHVGGESYSAALEGHAGRMPGRVAWSADLGGAVPVEPRVVEVCEAAARMLAAASGADLVDGACMDLSRAREVFHVLRAETFKDKAAILRHADKVKPEMVWQIEQGLELSEADVARARKGHRQLLLSTADFFANTADILCCPCTMVPPFDVKTRWLRECEGWELRSYIDWLMPTSVLSLTNW